MSSIKIILKDVQSAENIPVEPVIDAVQKEQVVWRKKHRNHKKRSCTTKAWDRILDELNYNNTKDNREKVRNKWDKLKCRFRIEHEKRYKGRSGDGADEGEEHESVWPYYKQLLFLAENLERRVTHSNQYPTGRVKEENDSHADTKMDDSPKNSASSCSRAPDIKPKSERTLSSLKRKRSSGSDDQLSIAEQILAVEKEKLNQISNAAMSAEEEEWMSFFQVACLPTLKNLSKMESHDARVAFMATLKQFIRDEAPPKSKRIKLEPTKRASVDLTKVKLESSRSNETSASAIEDVILISDSEDSSDEFPDHKSNYQNSDPETDERSTNTSRSGSPSDFDENPTKSDLAGKCEGINATSLSEPLELQTHGSNGHVSANVSVQECPDSSNYDFSTRSVSTGSQLTVSTQKSENSKTNSVHGTHQQHDQNVMTPLDHQTSNPNDSYSSVQQQQQQQPNYQNHHYYTPDYTRHNPYQNLHEWSVYPPADQGIGQGMLYNGNHYLPSYQPYHNALANVNAQPLPHPPHESYRDNRQP